MTTVLIVAFALGYAAIAFEHTINVNKAAAALVTGAVCWVGYSAMAPGAAVPSELGEHLAGIAAVLFFLLGAMTIVELIDAHDGFQIVADAIHTRSRRRLVLVITAISFLLSSIIDNLTATIVMVSLVRKLVPEREDRLLIVGIIVIAANAGGAFSPIGDVTTTMLWIGGQVSTLGIMSQTFLASVTCAAVPALAVAARQSGLVTGATDRRVDVPETTATERRLVFTLGVGSLLFAPVFKSLTGLPPYMGILLALGVLWVVTEVIHSGKNDQDRGGLSVSRALQRIDVPSVLFFLGILLAVSALESSGLLGRGAAWLDQTVGNIDVVGVILGLYSAVIDNVPLVAAAQGAYPLSRFPIDHSFWSLVAYCAGTGGSVLIIGSAAGVVAMGLERIEFFWYARRIGWLALIGYLAGVAVFLLQRRLLS
jgi:Na+/H+ antiporter NhaD/arsenite permease-like protein